jgi:hypothetical protein
VNVHRAALLIRRGALTSALYLIFDFWGYVMRRISIAIVTLALALTFAAPLTAQAAGPSASYFLKEQIASRYQICALLGTLSNHGNWVSSISFGHMSKSTNKAIIDITMRTRSGASVPGKLWMARYSGQWYFYSITRGTTARGISNVAIPAGITTSGFANALAEQRQHQYLMTGILYGGYKKLTVLSRTTGWNTRSVAVQLSGGTRHSTTARAYGYRETADNGTAYYFLRVLR